MPKTIFVSSLFFSSGEVKDERKKLLRIGWSFLYVQSGLAATSVGACRAFLGVEDDDCGDEEKARG